MFKKLAVLVLAVSSTVLAQDLPKEMYMPNDADGYIVLTSEPCNFTVATRLGYPYRAYATEISGTVTNQHEGCWDSPSTADAPKIEGVKIIPLVNTWWESGDQATFQQNQFGPEKKRWGTVAPAIEVKPNL